MQEQIDGNITTWFYEGVPTIENFPASEWGDTKNVHLGDLYYDTSTGKAYRFAIENNVYKWIQINDSDVTEALALANAAKDTADSKRRIFVTQPVPPYDNGDLWIKNKEIFICQIAKTEEQTYDENDFINNLKYTDNTVANAIVDELGGTTTTVLSGQVVQITDGFAKYTDLANPNSSTTIAGEHIKTGSISSNNYIPNQKGTNINLLNGTIDTKNFKVDPDGNISLYNGAKVIGDNGLMTTYMQSKSGFLGYFYEQFSAATEKNNFIFDIVIPEGFEITNARIIGYHAPVKWGWRDIYTEIDSSVWGYSRGIKLYKATNINSKKYEAYMNSEFIETDGTTYTEITNALGASGWTADIPIESSHNVQKFESSNIKNIFQNNEETIPGIYQIKMEQEENPTTGWGARESLERSGYIVSVLLIIDGYMTYGMNDNCIITEDGNSIITENGNSIIIEGGN